MRSLRTLVRSSSSVAAIDNLAQELCRRATAATVDRARVAARAVTAAWVGIASTL